MIYFVIVHVPLPRGRSESVFFLTLCLLMHLFRAHRPVPDLHGRWPLEFSVTTAAVAVQLGLFWKLFLIGFFRHSGHQLLTPLFFADFAEVYTYRYTANVIFCLEPAAAFAVRAGFRPSEVWFNRGERFVYPPIQPF